MTWSIKDKQVIVTGGTSGIGRATAAELARRGARVTVTSRSQADAEHAAAAISRDTGGDVDPDVLDLSSLGAVRDFVARYTARHEASTC